MLGQQMKYDGSMNLFGESIDKLKPKERAMKGLSGLNQQATLFWEMTVYQNLLTICEFLKIEKSLQIQKIDQALERVGLGKVKNQKAKTLSGGEQRRLEIARILLQPPKLILLDEPFAGLDAMAVQSLVEMLKELMEQGVKVMLSDHQIHPLLSCSDHILWIDSGTILALEAKDVFVNRVEIQKLV